MWVRIVTNLLAWLSAFLIVLGLFSLFGPQLQSQPLVVRALIVSGVMAVLMLNVVMPVLLRVIGRWQRAPATRPRAEDAAG
jgi:antibiotic biosynthesis monooxygenase (ABM) superfamily enzyme